MRNDQIAVLLRDFANRCLQWAQVMEDEGQVPFPEVPVQLPGDRSVSRAEMTHPSNTGEVSFSSDVHSRREEAPGGKGDVPQKFLCRGCNRIQVWASQIPIWPEAVCLECYRAGVKR